MNLPYLFHLGMLATKSFSTPATNSRSRPKRLDMNFLTLSDIVEGVIDMVVGNGIRKNGNRQVDEGGKRLERWQ